MDALVKSIGDSYLVVNWFAMGDAIRLCQKYDPILAEYRKKPKDKTVQKKVVALATEVSEFLSLSATDEARSANKSIQDNLYTLKLEGKIK